MTVDHPAMDFVQETLRSDPGPPPPAPFLQHEPRSFGSNPISIDRYISTETLRLEYERLWSRVWQWACNKEDIPEVGDHLVYDIGDRSVLLVRVSPDEIKAYHNACLHRGRQLREGPGNSPQLMCGFHGWTWNLDGSLAFVPCRWDFPQVTDEGFRLPEVRCETWSQFVFITFDDDAEPLLQHLDVLPAHFEHFPMDDKFTAAWVQKILPANWKTAMEAFLEGWHTFITHPQVIEHLNDADTQYDVWRTSSRLYTASGVPSTHLGPVDDADVYAAAVEFYTGSSDGFSTDLPEGQSSREAIAGLTRTMMNTFLGVDLTSFSVAEVIDHIEYWVFPNWCPFPGATNALQFRFRPNGNDPDSCIFDVRMMFPIPAGQERPRAAKVHVLQLGESWANAPELMQFSQIMEQDESNLRALQRGMKATAMRGLPFSVYQESRIRHFHTLLERYLCTDEPSTR